MKTIKKHLWYYVVSCGIFITGLLLVVAAKADHNLQAMLIILIALIYFVWSLLHHYIHHHLHPRIVVEYALMTVLGIVLALFLFGN